MKVEFSKFESCVLAQCIGPLLQYQASLEHVENPAGTAAT